MTPGRTGVDPLGAADSAVTRVAASQRRAVVTGAAGFIGSHLVEALLARGHEVIGIDAFTPYYDPALKRANLAAAARHPRFQLLPARLLDLDLHAVLKPGDTIFHLAAQVGVRSSWGESFCDYTRDNIDATQHLLEAARRRDVARVIYSSSSSVYGDAPLPMAEAGPLHPISPYGVTKLSAEQLCDVYGQAFGVEVVPLRLFTVYGPRQRPDMAFHRFIRAIAAGRPVTVYGDGRQRRDVTFVDDVVRILLAAAERGVPGHPVNVAGGSTTSIAEAIAVIESLVRRAAIVNHEPAPPGDARDTLAETGRLDALAAGPRTEVDEGLRRQVDWQLARGDGETSRRPDAQRTAQARSAARGLTAMLYSHDTYGLGHLRRNLSLGHALMARDPSSRVVLVSGSRVATAWRLPRNMSVVQLPAAVKTGAEQYAPVGTGTMPLVLAQRSGLLATLLMRVRPDVLLVDHAPLGMKGELALTLSLARESMPDTRVILGLRDILDDPAVVRRTWAEQGIAGTLEEFYDQVLVYGCRDIFDISELYGLSETVRQRTTFVGYIAKDAAMEARAGRPVPGRPPGTRSERRVLVLGGGGGDAMQLFRRFLDAWPSLHRVVGARALLVAGPLMGDHEVDEVVQRAGLLEGATVVRFSRNVLALIESVDLVVTMGGYNSVVEAVSAGKPVLVCPRTVPRREQLIRAEALAARGLVTVHRFDRQRGDTLAEAVLRAWASGPPSTDARGRIDLRGAERVCDIVLSQRADAHAEAVA